MKLVEHGGASSCVSSPRNSLESRYFYHFCFREEEPKKIREEINDLGAVSGKGEKQDSNTVLCPEPRA